MNNHFSVSGLRTSVRSRVRTLVRSTVAGACLTAAACDRLPSPFSDQGEVLEMRKKPGVIIDLDAQPAIARLSSDIVSKLSERAQAEAQAMTDAVSSDQARREWHRDELWEAPYFGLTSALDKDHSVAAKVIRDSRSPYPRLIIISQHHATAELVSFSQFVLRWDEAYWPRIEGPRTLLIAADQRVALLSAGAPVEWHAVQLLRPAGPTDQQNAEEAAMLQRFLAQFSAADAAQRLPHALGDVRIVRPL